MEPGKLFGAEDFVGAEGSVEVCMLVRQDRMQTDTALSHCLRIKPPFQNAT